MKFRYQDTCVLDKHRCAYSSNRTVQKYFFMFKSCVSKFVKASILNKQRIEFTSRYKKECLLCVTYLQEFLAILVAS